MEHKWKRHKSIDGIQVWIDTETEGGPYYAIADSTLVHTSESAAVAEARTASYLRQPEVPVERKGIKM